MSEGPRYYLEIEIRRLIEAVIADPDTKKLADIADSIWLTADIAGFNVTDLAQTTSQVRRQLRGEAEAAARLATARQRRPGETDAEHAARLLLWGLADD